MVPADELDNTFLMSALIASPALAETVSRMGLLLKDISDAVYGQDVDLTKAVQLGRKLEELATQARTIARTEAGARSASARFFLRRVCGAAPPSKGRGVPRRAWRKGGRLPPSYITR